MRAWLTPETIPAGARCARIRIPDSDDFEAAFKGALLLLAEPYNWEQFGAATPSQCAALFDTAYDEYVQKGASFCMIGAILPICTDDTPAHMLLCDGSTYNRTSYPLLYEAIAAALKIDADTFTVPDLRSRFILGASSADFLDIGGESEHTLTTDEMPAHSHTDLGHIHSYSENPTAVAVSPGEVPFALPSIPFTGSTSNGNANLTSTGGGTAHNNMPPYLVLKYAVIAE